MEQVLSIVVIFYFLFFFIKRSIVVLIWVVDAFRKCNSSPPRLSDPPNPLTQKSEFATQQNADNHHHSVPPDFADHEGFDDQVFTPSSSLSDVAISTTIPEEEQSPHSSVDDPKEVSPSSIVVDNREESIPLISGDFDLDRISRAIEKLLTDRICREIEKFRGEEKKKRKKRKKRDLIKPGIWMKHYCSSHKILLVGEGDFSFSACLGKAFGRADNMVATSLNSREFLKKNYGKAMSNIQSLRSRGCRVIHEVDATEMAGYKHLNVVEYDRIVFNFPHAGFSNKESVEDEVRRHQNLVSRFMANAKKMIVETGEIHISHKCTGLFQQWNLRKLGKKNGLVLMEEVEFNLSDYPGYKTKYGYGGDKNFNCNPSKTYKFRLKRRRPPRTEKLISWQPPRPDFVKLNTDGSYLGSSHWSTAGGLVRSPGGDWLVGFEYNIGHSGSTLMAELRGIYQGLCICWREGYRKIEVEVDSKRALNLITGASSSVNHNYRIIRDIKRLISRDWKLIFSHTYREGNRAADTLATLAHGLPLGLSVLESPPVQLRKILLDDVRGVWTP